MTTTETVAGTTAADETTELAEIANRWITSPHMVQMTSGDQLAAALRALADRLSLVGAIAPTSMSLFIQPLRVQDGSDVAAVDAIASALGTDAQRKEMGDGSFQHTTRHRPDASTAVKVLVSVDPPAKEPATEEPERTLTAVENWADVHTYTCGCGTAITDDDPVELREKIAAHECGPTQTEPPRVLPTPPADAYDATVEDETPPLAHGDAGYEVTDGHSTYQCHCGQTFSGPDEVAGARFGEHLEKYAPTGPVSFAEVFADVEQLDDEIARRCAEAGIADESAVA